MQLRCTRLEKSPTVPKQIDNYMTLWCQAGVKRRSFHVLANWNTFGIAQFPLGVQLQIVSIHTSQKIKYHPASRKTLSSRNKSSRTRNSHPLDSTPKLTMSSGVLIADYHQQRVKSVGYQLAKRTERA
ncbi:hypothetical protein QE152_g1962 [Popillia japonica]|uniref:Uncharacterized protein n=1 Tax=Popillia japonica TaxID=7064 RepID=A0AAW1N7B7_POPJA